MPKHSWVAVAALALVAADVPRSDSTAEPVIENCVVNSIDKQDVPASDSGVLMSLSVREGTQVKQGDELARVDDREATAMFDVKHAEWVASEQKAKSKVGIDHAKANVKVAEADLRMKNDANSRSKKTISDIEIIKSEYELDRARFAVDKESEDSVVNEMTAKAKAAEVVMAKVALERRTLKAPYDGMVAKVSCRVGEWVAPGDKVVQIVRIDRLRVSGSLDATRWYPSEIAGRAVTVEIKLPRGKTREVPGKVTYASPIVGPGRTFDVQAEISSPIEDGGPVVRDGMEAKMTIHVNRPAAPEGRPVAAPTKAPAQGLETKGNGAAPAKAPAGKSK